MLRVLIVEDDALAAMYLEEVINDISAAIVVVSASVAGTKDALNASFDIAFLDVEVTNGQTFDVARTLQEKEIPFAFVSGSSRADVPDGLHSAPFIPKPFHRGEIADALSSLLPERNF
jgi:DNA-binding response OmpR family regulator